ncbi:MAG: hypothetical protein ACP5GF_13420, partial [Thiomonas sp.]
MIGTHLLQYRSGGVVGIEKVFRMHFDKANLWLHGVKRSVRISAIVDACFSLIVDGVSARSWTR